MTLFFLLLGLLALPSMLTLSDDPAPGLVTSIESSRRLLCERASLEVARRTHPGILEEVYPRGDFIERTAVLCDEAVFAPGQRNARDDAILGTLSASTTALAQQLMAAGDKHRERTWLVEVHYPNAAVVSKISFASKSALVESGLAVTDRLPTLAAGDIDVLARTPAMDAHALACRRYFARGKLGREDAVLSVLILDSRETALHAGTCIDGRWTWLR